MTKSNISETVLSTFDGTINKQGKSKEQLIAEEIYEQLGKPLFNRNNRIKKKEREKKEREKEEREKKDGRQLEFDFELKSEADFLRQEWKKYQHRVIRGRCIKGCFPSAWITKQWIAQKGKCPLCGNELGTDFHLDHIVPISAGGPNVSWNLQLTHPVCNIQKGTRWGV